MFYARIRTTGKQHEGSIIGLPVDGFATLEELWVYVRRNLSMYLWDWQIPSCPPYVEQMNLLKHITPDTPGYVCRVHTGAVFFWQFFSDKGYSPSYILEVWDADADIALPYEFHQRSDL